MRRCSIAPKLLPRCDTHVSHLQSIEPRPSRRSITTISSVGAVLGEKYSGADMKLMEGLEPPSRAVDLLARKRRDSKWVSMNDPKGRRSSCRSDHCNDSRSDGLWQEWAGVNHGFEVDHRLLPESKRKVSVSVTTEFMIVAAKEPASLWRACRFAGNGQRVRKLSPFAAPCADRFILQPLSSYAWKILQIRRLRWDD